ncbi:MAG: heterodisulfide reductase subunit C [Euryarchaeota archaeon]|nr:heterodisulfide reductase subunit C [Euryarchaeota archaeon]
MPAASDVSYQPVRLRECEADFVTQVEEHGGRDAHLCYQCGSCSGGCPVVFMMDHTPRKLLRMINLGMKDQVLASGTIWVCASCFTCTTRCPRGIDIAKVMTACRELAQKEGREIDNPRSPAFYQSFVEIVENYGRLFEPMLMAKIAMRTRDGPIDAARELVKDAPLGLEMARRGKLSLLPHRTKDLEQVRKIVRKVREMEVRK